ncbi:MAG: tungstate transport system substrate-binding protein [Eubacteriales bacterium]|nr:tungstate transport system substrate-binding protein [Eubacteriales bacterium]
MRAIRKTPFLLTFFCLGLLLLLVTGGCNAAKNSAKKEIILATTTSTQDSGLLDVLIPAFEKKYGYKVKVIAVGSGQAIAMGAKGRADVLLTHAPAAEKKELVDKGLVKDYRQVMYNDFLLVGPPEDPAGVRGEKVLTAMKKIAAGHFLFLSRGDDSGTHKKELELWQKAGIKPGGAWYQETGTGMGQTLDIALQKKGYTLTDRATFLTFVRNRKEKMIVVAEKDPELLNYYHVAAVNPDKFPAVNYRGAKAFVDFLTGEEGQKMIAAFGQKEFGQSLFIPAAK